MHTVYLNLTIRHSQLHYLCETSPFKETVKPQFPNMETLLVAGWLA